MKKKSFSFGYSFPEMLGLGKRGFSRRRSSLKEASSWHEGIILQNPISKRRLGETISETFSIWRLVPIYLLIGLVFITLIARLVVLQLIEGPIFLSQAQGNGIRIKTIHAPRGVIYDRNGEVIARNRPAFRVAWDLSKTKLEERERVKSELVALLKVNGEEISKKIATFDQEVKKGVKGGEVITVKLDVDQETILKLTTKINNLPGVLEEAAPVRDYPYGEVVANILGYTGEVSTEELNIEEFANYRLGDHLGKDGVEKEFESQLRGQAGQELIKVDSAGTKLGTVYQSRPVAGGDLVLSLDINLQKKAYEALKKVVIQKGAPGGSVVVSDPQTGEILALVTYPSYDNNLFAKGISGQDYSQLASDKRTPLLNRPIGAAYPPGSTFKIITAASGLQSGKISGQTIYEDTGTVSLGPIVFSNWYWNQYGRKEGSVDVVKALQRSNDTYFYLASMQIGEKLIQEYASKFGLGAQTGINIPGEITGLVPTDSWKRKVRNEPWYPGNTLNLAIGQGDLLATPIQVNSMAVVIANKGKLLKPTLVKNDTGQVIREDLLSEANLNLIRQGMEKVVTPGGTAWPFFGYKIPTAGKTGTAESSAEEPHAWYTAYAPAVDPQLAITTMLEKAGEGSSVASPVAKEIMDWWFFERVGKKPIEASSSGERIGD